VLIDLQMLASGTLQQGMHQNRTQFLALRYSMSPRRYVHVTRVRKSVSRTFLIISDAHMHSSLSTDGKTNTTKTSLHSPHVARDKCQC
jgi:uncharacterized protein YueI